MGVETDQELAQLVGTEDEIFENLLPSIEECRKTEVYTQSQAIKYIAGKMKQKRFGPPAGTTQSRKSAEDDVRELLATTILAHIPVFDCLRT